MTPPDDLARGTDVPVYEQLASILAARIESGELAPRYPLPSRSAIKQEFGVADGTVRKAIDLLREQGLVRTVQGLGIFVTDPSRRRKKR